MLPLPDPSHAELHHESRWELRRQMRAQRSSLSPAEQARAALQVARRIAHSTLFQRSRHIACYLPQRGELDPTPLMQRAWAMRKTCYLPVLSPLPGGRLWFVPYRQGDPLTPNRFGILEPCLSTMHRAPPWMLDLVLTPLVAFDTQGNRLGMGGGFYDKTFSFMRQRKHWRKPHLVGLAYDFQCVATLQHFPWDVPLQAIATELRLYLPTRLPTKDAP